MPPPSEEKPGFSRRTFGRTFIGSVVAAGTTSAIPVPGATTNTENAAPVACTLTVNGRKQTVDVDPRTTLLDLLRENLHLIGTKKGCDHGQCGACTLLVNGVRVNSCLSFAVMHDGDEIISIEGLAQGEQLHPMQAAFIDHDGFQCGYCTPGQICSAVAMLAEAKAGAPSFVTRNLTEQVELTDDEIRERMSGNVCRCGAYPNIVAAIRSVYEGSKA